MGASDLRDGTAALRTLLEPAGLGQHLEAFLSVEEAGIWKPGRGRDGSGRPDRGAVLSILLRVQAYASRVKSDHALERTGSDRAPGQDG